MYLKNMTVWFEIPADGARCKINALLMVVCGGVARIWMCDLQRQGQGRFTLFTFW